VLKSWGTQTDPIDSVFFNAGSTQQQPTHANRREVIPEIGHTNPKKWLLRKALQMDIGLKIFINV
jgi:hypothetical protein